jgi:glycosyltransferase involved in cell wall biosynthesis
MYHFVRRGSTPLALYRLKAGLYRFLVWWSHRKSQYIIVPTQTVAREFAKLQPFTKQKIIVTYEASEPPLKDAAQKPEYIDKPFIMYVGTAFPHKNLGTLVKAFSILRVHQPGLRLVLVGKKDKHYEELASLVQKLGVADAVIMTGWIEDTVLKWLYEHCEAYVFTSLSEGFGLPPLEAMTYGAPVVSSNASAMPEVYADAAYYCNARSAEDIASKIDDVLTNPQLRHKLVLAGYEQIKKYSWHKTAEETLIIYKEALGETEAG